jgi:hypothetical protein
MPGRAPQKIIATVYTLHSLPFLQDGHPEIVLTLTGTQVLLV